MQSARGFYRQRSFADLMEVLIWETQIPVVIYIPSLFSHLFVHIYFLPSLFTPHFLKIAEWQSKAQCFLKTFNQRTFSIFQLCPLITHRFLIFLFLIVRLSQKSVKDHIQSARNNKQSVWQIRKVINGNVYRT